MKKQFLLASIALACTLTQAQTQPTLRSLADARGIYIGAAIAPIFYDTTEPDYPKVLVREYNMVVAENIMKWAALSSGRDKYSFFGADGLVAFAEKNKMAVRGHTLVWHESLPSWVTTIKNKNEMRNVLKNHVQTVVKHFAGKVFAWDVLNEAILEDGSYRKTPFYNLLGEEFIPDLFRWAREADPSVKLFYNDYSAEGINPKSNAIYELLKKMRNNGVPVNGVGFQTHVDSNFSPTSAKMQLNLERFRALGLEVQLTEIDVNLANDGSSKAERLTAQAKVYKDLMQTCLLPSIKCTAFITWGFTDAFSWRAGGSPLPFDSNYKPKPAYFALLEALKAPTSASTVPTAPSVATTATAMNSLTLTFAQFQNNSLQTLQGGTIFKTEYSQHPSDASVQSLAVVNNLLTVNYKLSKAAGSTFAGAGVNIAAAKPFDARGYTKLRLKLSSSQATELRIRVSSTDQTIIEAGCYPVKYIKVTPQLSTYELPLKDFASLGYCGARSQKLENTLANLNLIEIADEGLPNFGTREGKIELGLIELY